MTEATIDQHRELFTSTMLESILHSIQCAKQLHMTWKIDLREVKGNYVDIVKTANESKTAIVTDAQLCRFGFTTERDVINAVAEFEIKVDESRVFKINDIPIWTMDGPAIRKWKMSSPIYQIQRDRLQPFPEPLWLIAGY